MTLNQLWVIARHPVVLITATTLYIVLFYLSLCYPEQQHWQQSQSLLKEAQQHCDHQHNQWEQCQHPLNKNTQPYLWSYLNHQIHTPSAANQAEELLSYFHSHHLSIEHYSTVEPSSQHQQHALYRVCGKYPDIKRMLVDWAKPPFQAWIQTINIQPCPEKHSQLQLTLLLENTHD